MEEKPSPAVIFVFSGKRKSGKDYVTDLLKERLGDAACEIMRLSAPLKKQYAAEHNLDYERLMDASDYKEKVRVDMIAWGEAKRNADPGFFARLTTLQNPGVKKPVWIVSDARRKTDLYYFKTEYSAATVTVRVTASITTREERGWVFTKNVDDAESECDLDEGVTFDIIIENDKNEAELQKGINELIEHVEKKLSKRQSWSV